MNPALREDLSRRLLAENEMLRERVALLERELAGGGIVTPLEWRLTTSEEIVFGALVAREIATKEFLMTLLYRGLQQDEAEIKIADVFICKVRGKLKPFGIRIETRWGRGWSLDPATRMRFQKQHDGARAANQVSINQQWGACA